MNWISCKWAASRCAATTSISSPLGAGLGEYQQKVRTAAYRHVRTWKQAIDVGGHIGIFSRDFARHFEQVQAFEPMPFNRRCLELNAAGNTTIHAVGLGDRPGLHGDALQLAQLRRFGGDRSKRDP